MRERRSESEKPGPETRGSLLDAIRGVKWPSLRAATGALPGAHHSKLRGSAPELSEYRVYRQGDDPKRIDWRLLARSDRAYIRLAEDHSVVPTLIVVDGTASMAFPPKSLGKWATACDLAIGLAAVAHTSRDPVGIVIVTGKGMRQLPPRTRRGIVGEIARALDTTTAEGSAPVAAALAGVRPRTRIAIISDFLGDADDLKRRAGEVAAAGGEVHAIHVLADEELDPPARSMLAIDPEDASISRLLVADARAAYTERFGEWRALLASAWRGEGLSYTLAQVSEPSSRVVRRVASGALGVGRDATLHARGEAR
ncbi:MAG TPA: DUF58 domain-containing protein [Gemmatimonadaceae bacterium]|nr:DUF58 domain-containing protein [Gemmatimonadaceae bacterium]